MVRVNLCEDRILSLREIRKIDELPDLCPQSKHLNRVHLLRINIPTAGNEDLLVYI